jgi:two-component system sensor histidine kinase VanS
VIEDEESKNFYCDVIVDEAVKMNKMVLELLDLSQIEAGYFQLEKEIFDLSTLVQQMVAKYEFIFKEGKIGLIGDKQEKLLVYADRSRIEQVLTNYLNNAINHVDDRQEIRVTLEKRGSKVRIAVFNTGLPIPEEARDKIFTSFYKVDKARTRAYGGTGLGLSIVRAIMDLHKNNFGTENMPEGVEFWFELDKAELA